MNSKESFFGMVLYFYRFKNIVEKNKLMCYNIMNFIFIKGEING